MIMINKLFAGLLGIFLGLVGTQALNTGSAISIICLALAVIAICHALFYEKEED